MSHKSTMLEIFLVIVLFIHDNVSVNFYLIFTI